MHLIELASGTVNTTDAAVITVPAGEHWEARQITLEQDSTGVAKVWRIGRGTTATAANVKQSRDISAGRYNEVIHIMFGLAAAQTLNMASSAGANELKYTVMGYKHKIT